MSYCVNCGVELDASAKECPLCNTPILNPRELEKIMKSREPFPSQKGQVEAVKRKDMGILITMVLLSTVVGCALLNWLVYSYRRWSLPIIGACMVLWVILVPLVIYVKQTIYVSVLYDGLAAGVYLYMLTFLTKGDEWFFGLGLPIVIFLTACTELLILLMNKLPKSFLGTALMFFVYLEVICVGLEMLIDSHLHGAISLSWSAVILTIGAILDISLITMLSHSRLRNAVRKRLHF